MKGEPAGRKVSARRYLAAAAGFRGDEHSARSHIDDPEPTVRLASLRALVRLGVAGEEDLAKAASDRSPLVRRGLCELASQLDRGDFLALLGDEDPTVLEAACFAVGEARDRRAVARLSEIASRHPDPLCREAAVAALGAIGDPAGKEAVLAALSDAPPIRRRATVALAAFQGNDVETALRERLEDRDWQVRQAAADVLGVSEPERR